jgi:hypothetical protein
MSLHEKEKPTASSPRVAVEEGQVAVHDEADGLVILGYRPELKRNRSMFTLLFQSLAIAAVRAYKRLCSQAVHSLTARC